MTIIRRAARAAPLLLPAAMAPLAATAREAPGQEAGPASAAIAHDRAHDRADDRFEALYTREWEWRHAPPEGDGDTAPGAVPARLPDVSAAWQERRLAYWRDVAARLDRIDPATLSPANRVNYAVYRAQIAELVESTEFREYEIPLNSAGGFWSDIDYTIRDRYADEAEYRRYLAMLSDIPRYFDQQMANMRAGAERGFIPPRVVLEGRDAAIAAIAEAGDPARTKFYAPLAAMPDTIPAATRRELQAEAKTIIARRVIPAHAKLLGYFRDDYLPAARATPGADGLPDGRAYYAWKVRQFTTLDQTPDAVHRIGLAEVTEIRARMRQVMDDVGFDGDLAAFLTFLRTDPRFYARTPADYLKEAAWTAKEFDGVAPRFFGRLPRTRFGIRPFPPETAPYTTGAAGGREIYWLNTYHLDSRPLYSLPALTLHESAPGHSWQMSLAAENDALPAFRRDTYISAYGEGWALYCEKLGQEMGLYHTPYQLFGMLSYQMWRAARLVVDTGIHAKGWSREQAVRYLIDNTAIGTHEIGTEIDRYISNPGQAVSYYTGQLAIERLRARAERALGRQFDIRAFHDTVLSLGSVPLPVLEERIDAFIAAGGPSPYAKGGAGKERS